MCLPHHRTADSGRPPGPHLAATAVCVLLVLLHLAGLPLSAHAQIFRGRVLTEGDETPVPTAYVRLLDTDGETAAVTFADSAGRYRLEAPTPGEYRIVAEQLGYEAFSSPLLAVGTADQVYPVDVVLRREPIPVEGVVVTAQRRERLERQIRSDLGVHPSSLRFRPIGPETIREQAKRGRNVVELIRQQQLPSLYVRGRGDDLCFRFVRSTRPCLPVYLDGAPLKPEFVSLVVLDLLESVVIVAPGESPSYRRGAVLLYSRRFLP